MDRTWSSAQIVRGPMISSAPWYDAVIEKDDHDAFQVVSNHLAGSTYLSAQEHANRYALRLYLNAAAMMQQPPCRIWAGPSSALRR
jgi:hypothetical protein